MSEIPTAILILGPTASGKTELAVDLVQRLPCEIVSVDSGQVYRGMDIGTAKPDQETLAIAPHRLIDIRDPADTYSAAEFREDALREIADIQARGRVPLFVGGTMLYFRALTQGLSDLPSADPAIRERLETEARDLGWSALHRRLARVDPAAAARIHPNDPQRIQRALEVYEITGSPLSELQAATVRRMPGQRFVKLALVPEDRRQLHRRIMQRFHGMLARGLVAEVEALYRREDLDRRRPSMRNVGYRQVWDYLDGSLSHDEMVERAVTATRQLAKRQLTWLRSEREAHIYPVPDRHLADKVLKYLAGIPNRLPL